LIAVRLAAVATRVVGSVAEDAAGSAKSFSQIFAGAAEASGDAARPVVESAGIVSAGDGGSVSGLTPRERLERAIRDLLDSAGIDLSRPIHIDVTSSGEIAVADAHREASTIEMTLRSDDSWGGLVADFFESEATSDYPGGRSRLVVGGPK
jgi:hypothetical protein